MSALMFSLCQINELLFAATSCRQHGTIQFWIEQIDLRDIKPGTVTRCHWLTKGARQVCIMIYNYHDSELGRLVWLPQLTPFSA
jgi:hypothetical protein